MALRRGEGGIRDALLAANAGPVEPAPAASPLILAIADLKGAYEAADRSRLRRSPREAPIGATLAAGEVAHMGSAPLVEMLAEVADAGSLAALRVAAPLSVSVSIYKLSWPEDEYTLGPKGRGVLVSPPFRRMTEPEALCIAAKVAALRTYAAGLDALKAAGWEWSEEDACFVLLEPDAQIVAWAGESAGRRPYSWCLNSDGNVGGYADTLPDAMRSAMAAAGTEVPT